MDEQVSVETAIAQLQGAWAMAEMFDRQIDRWQMLADRVDAELTEVQKTPVQAAARKRNG